MTCFKPLTRVKAGSHVRKKEMIKVCCLLLIKHDARRTLLKKDFPSSSSSFFTMTCMNMEYISGDEDMLLPLLHAQTTDPAPVCI